MFSNNSNISNNKDVDEKFINDTNTKCNDVTLTKDTTCGFWCLKNSILQRFANQTSYVVVYGMVGCSLAMTSTYYNGTITTMEKRFKIPSRNTGFILAGNDIAQVLCAWFLGYYAGRKHRPRWMSLGLLTFIGFCLLTAAPHFLYGSGMEALELTKEYHGNMYDQSGNGTLMKINLKQQQQQQQQQEQEQLKNLCHLMDNADNCENVTNEEINWLPQIILFVAQFIAGIGASLYYTLGITYMDDNTEKSKAPAMLSLSYFCGLLGPAAGYSLASYCLNLYIMPNLTPLIDSKDSRWLGAWWLGWLILAAILLACAFLIFLFPKELPAAAARRAIKSVYQNPIICPDDNIEKASFNDMLRTLKRFSCNRVLMYNMLSSLFYCFGYFPYWVFTAKYIEIQYHQTASTSSMVTGTVALVFSAIGILLAGFVLSKYKPNARYLAAWDIIVALVTATGFIAYAFIGCLANDTVLQHSVVLNSDNVDLIACTKQCHCDYVRFMPVCDIYNQTYISPCHAGCHNIQMNDATGIKFFTNCTCISDKQLSFTTSSSTTTTTTTTLTSSFKNDIHMAIASDTVKEGFCPVDCQRSFLTFLAVMCCLKFFAATGRASNLLLSMRAVQPQDKAAFMGLAMMLMSLITFIPAPIFFGWLFDRFCLVWGRTCNHKGNCWLYDSKNLRLTLNIVSSTFILLCIVLDFGVWYHAKNLQIFDDDDKPNDDNDDDNDKCICNEKRIKEELLTIKTKSSREH